MNMQNSEPFQCPDCFEYHDKAGYICPIRNLIMTGGESNYALWCEILRVKRDVRNFRQEINQSLREIKNELKLLNNKY
jgi:hypothetical protein